MPRRRARRGDRHAGRASARRRPSSSRQVADDGAAVDARRGAAPRRRARRAPPRAGTPCSSTKTAAAQRERARELLLAARGPHLRRRVVMSGAARSGGCPPRGRRGRGTGPGGRTSACRPRVVEDRARDALRARSPGRSARRGPRSSGSSPGSGAGAARRRRGCRCRSTPRNATRLPWSSDTRWKTGSSWRHGPHHDAQMLTTTGWPRSAPQLALERRRARRAGLVGVAVQRRERGRRAAELGAGPAPGRACARSGVCGRRGLRRLRQADDHDGDEADAAASDEQAAAHGAQGGKPARRVASPATMRYPDGDRRARGHAATEVLSPRSLGPVRPRLRVA